MKKLALNICILFSITGGIKAQTLNISNNGKEVKQVECDMKDVKLTVNFSKSAKEYDVVDIVIKRFPTKDYSQIPLDYYIKKHMAYEYRLSKESIDKGTHSFHLVNGDKSDLFVGYYNYYRLNEACNYNLRDFETLYNVVYVVGGTHSGYEWIDNKKVKTYDWSTIHTMEFEHKIGPVSNEITSIEGNFSLSRNLIESFDFDDYGDGEMMELRSKETTSGSGTIDMGSGEKTGRPASIYAKVMAFENRTIEEVKKNLEQQLIARSNYYYAKGIDPIFKSDELKDMVSPSLIVTLDESNSGGSGGSKLKSLGKKIGSAYNLNSGSTEKNKGALDQMLENSSNYFEWKNEEINGIMFETISMKYAEKQHFELDGNKNPIYKSEREKFEREYKILITEQNGVVLVLFAKQKGDEEFNGQIKNDYINIFSSIKMY